MISTISAIKRYYKLAQHSTLSSLQTPIKNPLSKPKTRPNSISVEDAFFGDSGKGAVVAKYVNMLGAGKKLYTIRYNGGANAGHETLWHGKKIVTHQLPVGLLQEHSINFILRGAVLHPEELYFEYKRVEKEMGSMPGALILDANTPLVLDTHRARETVMNRATTGSKGATGRGIASAYESVYGRYQITVRDILGPDRISILTEHYELYTKFIAGFDAKLEDTEIFSLVEKTRKRKVGTCKEFIERIETFIPFLNDITTHTMYESLQTAWNDSQNPVIFEGAQGIGLDPYHGVYPDVTASRPSSRYINDATYNVVNQQDISMKIAVMKTTYVSSVGQRILPTIKDEEYEQWIQTAFDEKGRSTGRLRDIYPVSIPIGQYLRKAAGYDYIAATHVDASTIDHSIQVITDYKHPETKKSVPYLPYQYHLENLNVEQVSFDGWDGKKTSTAKSYTDLPEEAQRYLGFLGLTLAPVIMTTWGADVFDYCVRY